MEQRLLACRHFRRRLFPMSTAATQAKAWCGMRGENTTIWPGRKAWLSPVGEDRLPTCAAVTARHRRLLRGRATVRRAQGGRRVVLHEHRTAVVRIVAVGCLARDFGHDLGLQARPAFVGEHERRLGLERSPPALE